MCGRYTLRSRGSAKFYGVPASELPFLAPRYNIAPTQNVPVILERGAERDLALFQWGLIPSWNKEPKGFINARAETLLDKPSFSESFQKRRCLIPADGFFVGAQWTIEATLLFPNEGRIAIRFCRHLGQLGTARRPYSLVRDHHYRS